VLALHAAAVLIGSVVWGILRPPAPRPVYRPLVRASLPSGASGREADQAGEPAWYPSGVPNGAMNGHGAPAPSGWSTQPRTVVTSRRVTTMVVEVARDGLASAKRLYRRQSDPATPNGAYPRNGVHAQNGTYAPDGAYQPAFTAWPGGAPEPNGAAPSTPNGDEHGWATNGRPASGWTATLSHDEVISVTQIDPSATTEDADGHGNDAVHSWLDGYLGGDGGKRTARWTWVEAAASTWLARGEANDPAAPRPAPIEASATVSDAHADEPRPAEAPVIEAQPIERQPAGDEVGTAAGEGRAPARPAANGNGASPG